MTAAVVFAYHDVGVRCLSVLLDQGVDVRLVVTHADDPHEEIWFASVARLAVDRGIPLALSSDLDQDVLAARVRACSPDFVFSFYYRHILPESVLAAARAAALNMHGSLLPAYRGRVPVNWAIIRGETATGATLHHMTERADAGDIVDQMSVPILGDDTALDVFRKVTCAAELVLHRTLPRLVAGTAQRVPQDGARSSRFGRRRPEDGLIDWRRPAREIHDLVRGVAPPYPGAWYAAGPHRVRVLRTLRESGRSPGPVPRLELRGDACVAICGDGAALRILAADVDGEPVAPTCLPVRGAFSARGP